MIREGGFVEKSNYLLFSQVSDLVLNKGMSAILGFLSRSSWTLMSENSQR